MKRTRPGDPQPCVLERPPERRAIDRIARFLEGGDRGSDADDLLDLARVAPGAPPGVADFYRRPQDYAIRVGASGDPWSRRLLGVFAALFRQSYLPDLPGGPEEFPVCQRVYRDARGRLHWDRYARVRGSLERLFVARVDGSRGRVDETFVLWGVPVRLAFDARVEGDALVLRMRRRRSSPLAWLARVEYRTCAAGDAGELRTTGDFRVAALAFHVETEFRMRKDAGSPP